MGDNVTCAGPLAAGQLVCPFSTTISAQGSYYLVIQRRKKSSAAVQAFSTWIEELIAQWRTGINRYVV
jgi:LysR family glycine cleavage system transcriptional activator